MIALWIILAFVSALLWTITSLMDKFVISHEMHDPKLASTVAGTSVFLILVTASLILAKEIFIPSRLILVSFFTGMIYIFAIYLYYSSVKEGEISKVVSFLSITPIFVLIFAFLFLGEKLSLLKYFGILLMVSGSFLISLNKNHSKKEYRYSIHKVFFIAIMASMLFAFRDLIIKYQSLQADLWSILFWMGLGSGFMSLYFFIRHHPHIKEKAQNGIKHIFFGRVLSAVALFVFFIAISMGSVSLVSALVKIQVLFVFFGTLLLSTFHPHVLREKITFQIIIQKIASIVSIIVGAFLII